MKSLLLLCLIGLSGCQAGYYAHLARGHVGLMADREPLQEVLAGDALSEHQRHQLLLAEMLL
ncbi:MAG: hypothetical protein V2I38_07050, partial [Alcanivoracaceae bacterium]|nr:hypothetical protein [Alcanivoracaceae bacterium]